MSQNLEEKSLRPEIEAAAHGRRRSSPPIDPATLDSRIVAVLHAAGEKKALDSTVLDLRGIAAFTDFFVIVSGTNQRQVQAISDGVVEDLKKAGTRAARVEGYQAAEWILIDYGDFVVHIFDEKARRFYDLERLWRDAARLDISSEQLLKVSSLKEEK